MNTEHQPDVTCEAMASLVDDLVDGTLDGAAEACVQAHLAGCSACRALAGDLRAIASTAASLPALKPRPEVWNRIARDVASARPAARVTPVVAFWTGWRVALAMAAVALVAVTASVSVLRAPLAPAVTPRQPVTQAHTTPGHQSAQDTVQDVDEHLRIADAHYQQAITELETLVGSAQATLDPAVAATLDKNLGIIDKAVRESREAIKAQPNNQIAQTSLFEALRQKVALLEDTIALINTMRKGDQAGAAKVIGGLSKS